MKCFITGANGFIGFRLAERLSAEGHTIKCLVRSFQKSQELSGLRGVTTVIGSLDDITALEKGVSGCDTVFHMAAYAKPWSKDKTLPFRVNVQGTENILKTSLQAGVRRFVFTSSAAVVGPSPGVEPIDESFVRTATFFNDYEETKNLAEKLVRENSQAGMETVIVNPTRAYGPGMMSKSNAVTIMIDRYSRGKWRIKPGNGSCVGNYVFIDDVVNGHILAAVKGRPGHSYLLGGDNLTFNSFFDVLGSATGRQRWLMPFPIWLMIAGAAAMQMQASLTNIPPMITVPWVKKYMNHWSVSSEKAVKELGYRITPFTDGVSITLDWLKGKQRP
jgi:nucleoside-diphosphate-sugar epimerase